MNNISAKHKNTIVGESTTSQLTIETIDNHIYFYSPINSDRCLALIKAIRGVDISLQNDYQQRGLDRLNHPQTPIWLHVQSTGGWLQSALSFSEQVNEIKSPIYSIVEGFAESAASIIVMSCTKRFMQSSATMLIHQFSAAMWGKYDEFKDEIKLQDLLMNIMINFYSSHSKLSKKKIKKILSHDSWFSANECLENGFVDEII